jgi:signal transduction histidine kinase
LFILHDVLVASAVIDTTYMSSYGFLTYGFGVANTLLMRYRRIAAELEGMTGELRQTTDELTSSYLELSDVQEELFRRRQLASVGELAASIAHEVRNPLAIIQNAGANLKRPSLGQKDRETLFEIIEEEIKRLNGLVTELLRFARPVNIQRSDVVLSELFKNVAAALDERYCLQTEIPEDADLHTVWADPALLRLAVDNLVENSCQAMPGGGTIHVKVGRSGADKRQGVRIEIRDEGAGMSEKTLQRATDPFFTTRPKGTGLGLPIVQRILEAHDGHLELQSDLKRGTAAILDLPLRRRDSVSHADLRRDVEAEPRPTVR